MRLTLTLVGLIAAFAFGMMTVVNSMQTASAGDNADDSGGDDVSIVCQNDDGDDDLPGNEEPRDDPDSEDGEATVTGAEPTIRIGGPEISDPEDHDPSYEGDDCPKPTPFGFCGNLTEPEVYLFADADYGGECVFFPVAPPAIPGDDGGPEASFAAADADCDGGVGVGDALVNLQYLSGFSAGCVGEPNGGSVQGDADCSGAIGGGDVTAILAAVATGADPGC